MAAKSERPDSVASVTTGSGGRAFTPSAPSQPSRPNTTEPAPAMRSTARTKTMAKPRSMLMRITARGSMRGRDQGLKEADVYRAGQGYGKGFGPCKPASASPCETALVNGLTDWQLPFSEAPQTEILLQNDKVELGEKYNMKISSRFQPLTATTSRYHFQLPTSEQNRRYSNMKLKPSEAQGPASIESTASQRPERPESDESRPPTRPTPMLTKLRMPVKEGLTRLRPGVAYSISRLEEWFLLLDTNRSGEVTVRKLILGMMKHQEIMDLVFLLREKSEGRLWQLRPEDRPTAGKLTRDDMHWVRAVLDELDAAGGASMTWPEFVDFFRQTGLLLEYSTRDELNQSELGETNMEEFLRRQQEEFDLDQVKFFSEQRRGARLVPASPEQSERRSSRSSCALAQTT
ncbi:PAT17 [Symbiodinium natans]|uniref:PAT17 protein n=1 Tax=Symbiodinium natans TaxID=878477 RepID=A0A812RIK2_9DINO|nr:PAT17 [Symbiodinium natans]